MEEGFKFSDIFNIIIGSLSVVGIISGFLLEEFRLILWVISIPVLIFIVFVYFMMDIRNRMAYLSGKFKKIEESLNIYERLNKFELAMKMRKKGEITLIDIIKIGLAIILIIVFALAIKSLL